MTNGKGDKTANATEIKRIIKGYYDQFNVNKVEMDEMDKIPPNKLSNPNQEEIESWVVCYS